MAVSSHHNTVIGWSLSCLYYGEGQSSLSDAFVVFMWPSSVVYDVDIMLHQSFTDVVIFY